ncbi:hypothetical protein GGI12_000440 [Dipsacomyces acuminosporus]|nr:hypothetical protein GGI12_000440 [Dipsacomyces acuminosporus]
MSEGRAARLELQTISGSNKIGVIGAAAILSEGDGRIIANILSTVVDILEVGRQRSSKTWGQRMTCKTKSAQEEEISRPATLPANAARESALRANAILKIVHFSNPSE